MTSTKTKLLRLTASVGFVTLLLCIAPTIAWINVGYAQPTPTAPVTTTGAVTTTQPAAVPAAAPAAAPVAAPEVATPAAPMAAPTPAPAALEQTQAWWQALLMPVLSVLGLFIAAFLTAGLRKLVQLMEQKWSIDIPDSIETLMTEKARWALAWAEEQAEKRLLYGDGKKTPSAEKLTSVVDLLEKFADSLGYGDAWQRDKIETLAEGVLHLERSAGVGSDGDRAAALKAKTPNEG